MGLFGRAKSILGGSSSQAGWGSQDYRVACPEGHVLRGTRTDGYQALRCETCGEAVFILPRSPLPEPSAPSTPPAKSESPRASFEDEFTYNEPQVSPRPRHAPAEPEGEAQIEWVDEAELPAEKSQETARAQLIPYQPDASIAEAEPSAPSKTSPKPKAKSQPVPKEPPARSVPPGMIEVEAKPSVKEQLLRNKNALIFTGVALLVVATVALRLRQNYLATLPAIVERGRTEGLTKLDMGDFHVAKQLLKEAAAAVESLGGQVDGADNVRQGAIEAALFADRVGERLETLLEGASKAESESAWNSKFSIYRGQSIILEATITAIPDPQKPDSSYQLDYEVLYGGAITPAGKGRIDLTGFRLFELVQPKVGDSKVFGARLDAMTFDKASGVWLFRLVPDSGCFITHTKALQILGWPTGDAEDGS